MCPRKSDVKKLTQTNKDVFFKVLQLGEVFTYSMSFDYREVKKRALDEGVKIMYCAVDSPEYKKYGCFTCKVIGGNVLGAPEIPPKTTEDKLVDALGEIADNIKAGTPPTFIQLLGIFFNHMGDDIESVTLSGTERRKLPDEM